MAEEAKGTTDPGVSTDPESKVDNMEQIERAELDRLKERDAILTELDGYAKEADMDGAKAYVEQLEIVANQNLTQPAATEEPAATTKTESVKPAEAPAEPAPAGMTAAQLTELEVSRKQSTQAMLGYQYMEFKGTQEGLPEEGRTLAARADLDGLIMKAPEAVKQLAQLRQHNGNVYSAANVLFAASPEGQKKIQDEAAAAEKAKADAAAGATIGTGGTTAAPSVTTEQQKALDEQKRLADAIAPDDPPYVPPLN